MRKTKIIMNKPVYLSQAILDISKTLMYESWYDYIKPKYKEKVQLCYMDTDSFIIHIFTETFCKDIAKDVKKWFDTSGEDKNDNRPLPTRINKKVIGKFKDELNGKIIKKLCGARAKTYAFKLDNDTKKKKAKETERCVIKHRVKFKHYYDSVYKNKTILTSQQRFKIDHYTVYTEEVTTYPYGKSVFKICAIEKIALKKIYTG